MMSYLDQFVGSSTSLPSKKWGKLRVEAARFTDAVDGDLVVYVGKPKETRNPLVRIHSECVFSEVLESELCDCRDQLHMAMQMLVTEGAGILFYLRLDGRGAGLAAKVKATALEVMGTDTWESRVTIGVSPESRSFRVIGEYLQSRGFSRVRLLTNNPGKVADLRDAQITVQRVPLIVDTASEHVIDLYRTKVEKFGHMIELPKQKMT